MKNFILILAVMFLTGCIDLSHPYWDGKASTTIETIDCHINYMGSLQPCTAEHKQMRDSTANLLKTLENTGHKYRMLEKHVHWLSNRETAKAILAYDVHSTEEAFHKLNGAVLVLGNDLATNDNVAEKLAQIQKEVQDDEYVFDLYATGRYLSGVEVVDINISADLKEAVAPMPVTDTQRARALQKKLSMFSTVANMDIAELTMLLQRSTISELVDMERPYKEVAELVAGALVQDRRIDIAVISGEEVNVYTTDKDLSSSVVGHHPVLDGMDIKRMHYAIMGQFKSHLDMYLPRTVKLYNGDTEIDLAAAVEMLPSVVEISITVVDDRNLDISLYTAANSPNTWNQVMGELETAAQEKRAAKVADVQAVFSDSYSALYSLLMKASENAYQTMRVQVIAARSGDVILDKTYDPAEIEYTIAEVAEVTYSNFLTNRSYTYELEGVGKISLDKALASTEWDSIMLVADVETAGVLLSRTPADPEE